MNKKILVLRENPPKTYKIALEKAGLSYDCEFLPKDYSAYFGLLLIGGGDILPAFYEKPVPSSDVNFIRDKAELSAIDYFFRRGLPILGICRGAQILNVYFGGTLKTVENHRGEDGSFKTHFALSLCPSKLPDLTVNSNHVQAIDELGKNGKPLMKAEDGTIEAVEFSDSAIGVQFHPERLKDEISALFFGEFSKKVKGVRGRK